MLEQPVPEGLQPVRRTHVGEVCGELCPMGGTPLESKEVGVAETTWDGLTATPVACSPVLLREGGGEIGSEVEPGKKGGVGGKCLEIWFYFLLSYSSLIGNKLNYFPQVKAVFTITIIGE